MPTRSEPASPRKLKRAKEFGDHPSSPQLARALTLGAGLCVIPSMFMLLWWHTGNQLRMAFRASDIDQKSLSHASRLAIINWVEICLPFLAVVAITQLASRLIEAGGLIARRQTGSTWQPFNLHRGSAGFLLGATYWLNFARLRYLC